MKTNIVDIFCMADDFSKLFDHADFRVKCNVVANIRQGLL
ncbi:Uncharacterised protein [Porphyromonas cangingivalis]|uniref:Uncharacterized protein n=1 Tax=Porphyromonas cangingivalis TaxID=36874 RepID=A0A1T4LDX9_PORCN|nr:hypothetical protein SAMN02745205_01108 [Porphyromonas cangingivalis]VEJ02163.1 Uncharacterised protein [Porphyromonas cangingivalis]